MKPQLDHTIVWVSDRDGSAAFLSEILGLDPPASFGQFLVVELSNGVSLDFAHTDAQISDQHYAFLVTEMDFDSIFDRIVSREVSYWADPFRSRAAEINHEDGGRGVYFLDPSGLLLEIITRPYGTGPAG